jgi:hypothetical protein
MLDAVRRWIVLDFSETILHGEALGVSKSIFGGTS